MTKDNTIEQDVGIIKWDLDSTHPNKNHNPISKLQRDPELASLIYQINTKKGHKAISEALTGYEIFSITTHPSSSKKEQKGSFQALAAINKETKEVVFVTAGTRLGSGLENFLADAKDDLHLGLGLYPEKLKAAKALNKRILTELGAEAADYTFHYTGHSLGAAMADAGATDMGIKLHDKGLLTKGKISTVTFDNPGAYTLVKNQLKEFNQQKIDKEIKRHQSALSKLSKTDVNKINKADKKHQENLEQLKKQRIKLNKEWKEKVQYKAFNNRANIINTADKQAGDKFVIVPNNQEKRNSFLQFINWTAKKFPGPIMKKILYLISYGALTEQVKDHSIDNFINVLKKENGKLLYVKDGAKQPISLLDAAYNIKPLEYDAELFVKLKKKISKRTEGSKDHKNPNYSMTFETTDEKGVTSGTRIEFTKDELSRARRTPTKTTNKKKTQSTKRKTSTKPHPVHPIPTKEAEGIITGLITHLKKSNSVHNTGRGSLQRKSSLDRRP